MTAAIYDGNGLRASMTTASGIQNFTWDWLELADRYGQPAGKEDFRADGEGFAAFAGVIFVGEVFTFFCGLFCGKCQANYRPEGVATNCSAQLFAFQFALPFGRDDLDHALVIDKRLPTVQLC